MLDNKKVLMVWSHSHAAKDGVREFYDSLPEGFIEKTYMMNGIRIPSRLVLRNGVEIDFKFESMGYVNFCGSRPAYIVDNRHSRRGPHFDMVDAYMNQMVIMGAKFTTELEVKELLCQG